MDASFSAYIYGFAFGFSLILAIGAQNAFVLKQGLRGRHVFWVCLICALGDALLISFGVAGFGLLIKRYPALVELSRYGGAAFLIVYGLRSFIAAFKSGQSLQPDTEAEVSLARTILICLGFTFLNPHVYLDTVVLLGAVANGFSGARLPFALGAIGASFVFFFALGYGARLLRPLFAWPKAWQILDCLIAIIMWLIAYQLLRG